MNGDAVAPLFGDDGGFGDVGQGGVWDAVVNSSRAAIWGQDNP